MEDFLKKDYILLVEDSPDNATLTLLALKRHNIDNEVVVVRDGSEVLDYLFATGPYAGRDIDLPPRLILMDLKLPKLNGLEVLRRLRSSDQTKFLPIIIFTSSCNEGDIEECLQCGANSYIRKPVDFDMFSETLHQVVFYWLSLNIPAPIVRTRKS